MRVALVRSDISRIYLDDVENTSQRDFSVESVGQSRYFEVPTDQKLASMLASTAFVTRVGSNAQTFDTTISNGTKLLIKAAAAVSYTTITVRSGAALTALQVVTDLNVGFKNAKLPFLARADSTNHVAIDSTVGGPAAYIQMDTTAAALATVLGLTLTALSGLTVQALKNAVYVGVTSLSKTGVAATVASVGKGVEGNVQATLTGVTAMTAADVGKVLTISNGATLNNNGTFYIVKVLSATSVVIANQDASSVDSNNGSIHWAEYATMSVDVSVATINALSSFASMTTAQKTSLDNAVANLVAPSLVETGPVLLSFVYGKLHKLASAAFQPGGTRIGLFAAPAIAVVASDGVTPFTI